MKILSNAEKKKILKKLNEQFGITKLPYLLLKFGKEKIKCYSGNLSKEEIATLDRTINIEDAGLYAFKEEKDGIRLTIDALSLFKDQIIKNIVDLTEKEMNEWMKGNDLEATDKQGYIILRYNDELIGCSKASPNKIANFLPKERRIQ